MKTLLEHRLFRYFTSCTQKDTQISAEELSSAYEEYTTYLVAFSKKEISTTEKLRELYYADVELTTLLQLLISYPDTLIRVYLQKTIRLIEIEIKLIYISMRHPQPKIPQQNTTLASLHWKGSLINLMELITSLDYSGIITNDSGQRQSFSGLVTVFEKLFHVKIPKPYDLRADLARRKKNLSVLLPQLKDAYEKNIVNCGVGKR